MGYAEITKPESEYTVHKTKENGISINVALISLYFFLSPMEDILNVGFGTILKYLAIIIVIFVLSNYKQYLKIDFFLKSSIYFIVLAWFSVAWSISKSTTIDRNTAYTLLPALLCVILILNFTEKERAFLDRAIVLGGLVTAIYIFATQGIGGMLTERLIISDTSDPNGLAGNLLLSLAVAAKLFTETRRGLWKAISAVAVIAVLSICMFTVSRGAFVSILAMILILFIYSPSKNKLKLILYISIGSYLIITILPTLVPMSFYTRIFSLESYLRETEGGARSVIWRYCIVDILPHSLPFGLGAGCSPIALLPYMGYASGVHNLYLNMLLEYGILGLPVFVLFLWKLIAMCRRNKNIFALCALAGVLVSSFFLDTFAKKYLWNVFMYCLINSYIPQRSS